MKIRFSILIVILFLIHIASPAAAAGPKILVDHEEFDFGTLEVHATGRHEFVLTNAGDRPLEVSRGKFTCGCCTCLCVTRLPEPATIAPGQSAKIALEWLSKAYSGPFRQTSTLLTNDPQRPEVTLRTVGRFVTAVRAVPAELTLGNLSAGQSAIAELRLYGYSGQPLKIAGWQWADPALAKHLDLALDPLSPEQLRDEAGARSGCRVRLTVKPGLPPGPFTQGVTLKTNSASVPAVKIPVKGSVVSDVTLAGRGWDARTGILALGDVPSRQGGEWSLLVLVRGPHAKDATLKLARAVPDFLKVDLSPATHLASGGLTQTRLTLRIPPGTPPARYLGPEPAHLGQITLQTSHPQQPQLQVLVRFAVVR